MDDTGKIAQEMKSAYYVLITDSRSEVRKKAAEKLNASGDRNMMKLVGAAEQVFRVLSDHAEPKSLESVIQVFRSMPQTRYWSGIALSTGEVLLTKGLAMDEKNEGRTSLLECGIKLASIYQSSGFPLSESTMSLIKRAKEDVPQLKQIADAIRIMNDCLVPGIRDSSAFPKLKEKPGRTKRGGRAHAS